MKAADPKNPTLAELRLATRVRDPYGAKAGYFGTISGGKCYLDEPERSDIRLEDIATALSRIARFGGHTQDFYSVAQHSVLVSRLCPPELALVGLLHDATEAYLGDIIGPLKARLGFYKGLEKEWATAIGQRFGLGNLLADLPDEVKRADLLALEVERHDLLPRGEGWGWWGLEDRPTDLLPVRPVSEVAAYLDFLGRYRSLGGAEGI